MAIRPAIKSALTIWASPNTGEVIIGSQYKSLHLSQTWFGVSTELLLKSFNGQNGIEQISQRSGVGIDQIQALINELKVHNFIDLERTPISYLKRYNSELGRITQVDDLEAVGQDYAVSSFIKRMEIESEAISLAPDDIDSGRGAVLKRREFSIIIFGFGKIVTALLGVLSASGFSKVLVINRQSNKSPALKISGEDIAGGVISRSDIGLARKEVLNKARISSLLFQDNLSPISKPDLIISVNSATPDVIQRWASEASTYLLVESSNAAEVRLGPLVIPGRTPCYHCLQLSQGVKRSNQRSQGIEVGSALAQVLSGIIALDVIALAAGGVSHFLSKSLIYSNSNFHNPKRERWAINPGCGCSWR